MRRKEKISTKRNMEKRKVRIFLDSNVILSGLISFQGAPGIILDLLSLDLPLIKGFTGKYNIIEIQRNINKKVPELYPVYTKYFSKTHLHIVALPSQEEVQNYTGAVSEKDIPVILSAEKCRADYLVTGDKELIQSKEKNDFPFEITTPSEFLEKRRRIVVNGEERKWKMENGE